MDFKNLASQIPSGAREEILKKIDELKSEVEGNLSDQNSGESKPETDQFVESRKPVAAATDPAGADEDAAGADAKDEEVG